MLLQLERSAPRRVAPLRRARRAARPLRRHHIPRIANRKFVRPSCDAWQRAGKPTKLVLDGFRRGEYQLTPQHHRQLVKAATGLIIWKKKRGRYGGVVWIVGHASLTGHKNMNVGLAMMRALQAESFLAALVPSVPMEVVSRGAFCPRVKGRSSYANRKNRRVEIWFRPS